MRIQWNAVSTNARARRELHETEWLGGSRVNYFPHVYTELLADDRHLVRQADVHGAESVLEQFDQLSRLGRRDRDDRVQAALIQRCGDLGACSGNTAYDLWCVFGVPHRVAGIDTLRAEREEDIAANLETCGFEFRLHQLPRRSGIRSALEHYEHPRVGVLADRRRCGDDKAHIRVASLDERRGDGDRNAVHFLDADRVRRGLEHPLADNFGEIGIRDVKNVGLSGIQEICHALGDVETDYLETGAGKFDGKRETHITESNNTDHS